MSTAGPKGYSQQTREALICEYRTTPSSIQDIAVKYGVVRSTVERWVQEFDGVPSEDMYDGPIPRSGRSGAIQVDDYGHVIQSHMRR